jgi:hypothetical protein
MFFSACRLYEERQPTLFHDYVDLPELAPTADTLDAYKKRKNNDCELCASVPF